MAEEDVQMEDASVSGPALRGGLSPEASRLFRVYKTIAAMLFKRGYMIPKDMREITPTSFTNKFGEHPSRESLTILVVSPVNKLNLLKLNIVRSTLHHL